MIQFTFEIFVYYISFLSIIPVIILTIYWIVKKEYYSVILRHVAGFIVGILDQFLMVLFNWQSSIISIVILFDYGLYSTWFLLMPSWKKFNPKIWMPIWIIFSGILNTILENVVRILTYGNLNYPIYWTQIHTLVFYLFMHLIGTIIASLNFIISKKSLHINKKSEKLTKI
ncbi:MAG: hypothetical protein ACTSQO_07775 [Candidatus Helarchaeota archaeon]